MPKLRPQTEEAFDKKFHVDLSQDGIANWRMWCGDTPLEFRVYPKDFKQFISTIEQQAEIRGAEEERERIKKHIYDMRKETTPQRNETISEVLYSIEKVLKALSSKEI